MKQNCSLAGDTTIFTRLINNNENFEEDLRKHLECFLYKNLTVNNDNSNCTQFTVKIKKVETSLKNNNVKGKSFCGLIKLWIFFLDLSRSSE